MLWRGVVPALLYFNLLSQFFWTVLYGEMPVHFYFELHLPDSLLKVSMFVWLNVACEGSGYTLVYDPFLLMMMVL